MVLLMMMTMTMTLVTPLAVVVVVVVGLVVHHRRRFLDLRGHIMRLDPSRALAAALQALPGTHTEYRRAGAGVAAGKPGTVHYDFTTFLSVELGHEFKSPRPCTQAFSHAAEDGA